MAEKRPVNVHAPIITEAGTAEGIAPFLNFVQGLKDNNNVDTAQAEAKRLDPYFKSMSRYLSEEVKSTRDKYSYSGNTFKRRLVQPQALSMIFNKMAAFTKNTLISDVAIMPDDARHTGQAQYIFKDRRQFSVPFYHNEHRIEFGFLQVYENTRDRMKRSTTTFPILFLDARMLEHVKTQNLKKLLRPLQRIMTMVNHDALHHFSSPLLNNAVADKFDSHHRTPLSAWDRTIAEYETWSHISHEQNLLATDKGRLVKDTKKAVNAYFDILTEIGRTFEDPQEGHKVVDYFGMTMGHALTRLFPLDHEIISHCLGRLKTADPMHDAVLDDMSRKLRTDRDATAIVRKYIDNHINDTKKSIVQGYKATGFDIDDTKTPDAAFKTLKRLQLIEISYLDTLAHAPLASHEEITDMRKNIGSTIVHMLEAAANTIGHETYAEINRIKLTPLKK